MTIFYPSYGRGNNVFAFEFFKSGFIVIPESPKKDYEKKYHKNIITIKDCEDGQIARKRNAIINLAKKMGIDRFYMIDDDINGLKNIWQGIEFDGKEALELLEVQYNLAEEMNVKMWGFQTSAQNFPKQYAPFSTNKMLDQIYGLDITDSLYFDENVNFYDNMDMCIQKLNKHRLIWRDNRHFFTEAYTKGGKDSQIKYNDDDRLYWQKIIQKKWGSKIVRLNGKNVRIKIPIKGI